MIKCIYLINAKLASSTVEEESQLNSHGTEFICITIDKKHLFYHQFSTG